MFDFRGAVEPTLFFWPCNTTDMSDARGVFSYADVDGHDDGATTISTEHGKPVYYNLGKVNVNKSTKEITLVGAGYSFSKMKPYSTLYIVFNRTDPGTSYTWYEVTYISPTKVQAVGTLPSDYTNISYCLRADWGSSFYLQALMGDHTGHEGYSRTITLTQATNFTIGAWVKVQTNQHNDNKEHPGTYSIACNGYSKIKIKIGDYYLLIRATNVDDKRRLYAFVNNETTVKASLSLGSWIFIGAVVNDGTIKFYVNATKLSGAINAPIATSELLLQCYMSTVRDGGINTDGSSYAYTDLTIDSVKYKEGGNFISEMYDGGASAEEF